MWKKPEHSATSVNPPSEPAFTAERKNSSAPAPAPSGKQALLGRSLTMEGTISGAEDLLIEGKMKGTVNLRENTVVVGRHGRVEGDIYARVITVEGEIVGNLHASEKASILQSGFVKGNVASPRVLVEDGARLKGSIDVDSKETEIRQLDVDLKQMKASHEADGAEGDDEADDLSAQIM